jgi:hypothetical protein
MYCVGMLMTLCWWCINAFRVGEGVEMKKSGKRKKDSWKHKKAKAHWLGLNSHSKQKPTRLSATNIQRFLPNLYFCQLPSQSFKSDWTANAGEAQQGGERKKRERWKKDSWQQKKSKDSLKKAGFELAKQTVNQIWSDIIATTRLRESTTKVCWCIDVLTCWCVVDDIVCRWLCWCVAVLMCWCVDVLMCWWVDVDEVEEECVPRKTQKRGTKHSWQ